MSAHKYYLTNSLAVDRNCAVKLADLCYGDSNRPDDCGSLFVAPITRASWDTPIGLLALFATTNGDPINLGQIEDGELSWFPDAREDLREVLARASWNHDARGEGYSYLVQDCCVEVQS